MSARYFIYVIDQMYIFILQRFSKKKFSGTLRKLLDLSMRCAEQFLFKFIVLIIILWSFISNSNVNRDQNAYICIIVKWRN